MARSRSDKGGDGKGEAEEVRSVGGECWGRKRRFDTPCLSTGNETVCVPCNGL